MEALLRGFEGELLSGSGVHSFCDGVAMMLGEQGHAGAFGQVPTDEPVGIQVVSPSYVHYKTMAVLHRPMHSWLAVPAIDAGDPGGCRDSLGSLILKDQRDFARHVDGNNDGIARCDIGAVEFDAGSATFVDFDGDGITDIGVYRNGIWFILRSFDGGVTATGWQDCPRTYLVQETMTGTAERT